MRARSFLCVRIPATFLAVCGLAWPSFVAAQTPYQAEDSVTVAIPSQQIYDTGVLGSVKEHVIMAAAGYDKSNSLPKAQQEQSAQDLLADLSPVLDLTGKHGFSTEGKVCPEESNLVIHVAIWRSSKIVNQTGDYALVKSAWAGYKRKISGDQCSLKIYFRSDNSPELRSSKAISFLGIDYFEATAAVPQVVYKLSTIPLVAQNIQDFGTAIEALTSVAAPAAAPMITTDDAIEGSPNPILTQLMVAAGRIPATALTPYSLGIAELVTASTAAQPAQTKLALPNGTVNQDYQFDIGSAITALPDDVQVALASTSSPSGCPVPMSSGSTQLEIKKPQVSPDGAFDCEYTFTSATTKNIPSMDTSFTVVAAATPLSANVASGQQKGGGGGAPNAGAPPAPGQVVDCSDVNSNNPCNFSRSFTVDDREYIDISLGMVIPGVTEEVYPGPVVYTSPTVPAGSPTKDVHTDAYALIDIYFLSRWFPKDHTFVPHINAGIPITSQPLHRPYVGFGFPLTKYLERKGFPFEIDAFAGVVDMKQTIYNVTTSTYQLDHAWRPAWGIEVPISAIASKLSGAAKSAAGGSKSGK